MNVFRCLACGHALYPARALCHRCGAAAWEAVACAGGTVETATTVRHGMSGPEPVHLACVRTREGVRVVARLPSRLAPGTPVQLNEEEGAVWARNET